MNSFSRTMVDRQKLFQQRLEQRGIDPSRFQGIARRSCQEAPLSFAQQRVWFAQQFEEKSTLYNVPIVLSVIGSLRVSILQRAISEIVARHETLRTSFKAIQGVPVQVIHPAREIDLRLVDLRGHDEKEQEQEVKRLVNIHLEAPFDLAVAPLLRCLLVRTKPNVHWLAIVLHHIASDGWSMSVFTRELAAFYRSFGAGRESPLPPLPIQYADYAMWQRDSIQENLQDQINYWKQQLAGIPALLELPISKPRPAVQNHQGRLLHFSLPEDLTRELRMLSRLAEATLFMVLLAVFQALLSRYSGQTDIVVGTPIAGRSRVETENLIGFFANTLALRTDLSGSLSFLELLSRVKKTALEAYAHADVPFEKLVEELQPERDLGRAPVFQVMFVLQNVPRTTWDLEGARLELQNIESAQMKFDLTMYVTETQRDLRLGIGYRSDLFEEAAIQRFVEHYEVLLRYAVDRTQTAIDQLEVLTPQERHQLLFDWNATKREYRCAKPVHWFFEEQVRKTPDAAALVCDEHILSYAELNGRANQLAHHLLTLNVGPEVPVGICMERSIAMVIALLAVLKAGGFYVPLDVHAPEQRLQSLMDDAGTQIVLAQNKVPQLCPSSCSRLTVLNVEQECSRISRQSRKICRYAPARTTWPICSIPRDQPAGRKGSVSSIGS